MAPTKAGVEPKKRRSFFSTALTFLPKIGESAKPTVQASYKTLEELLPPSAITENERLGRGVKRAVKEPKVANLDETADGNAEASGGASKSATAAATTSTTKTTTVTTTNGLPARASRLAALSAKRSLRSLSPDDAATPANGRKKQKRKANAAKKLVVGSASSAPSATTAAVKPKGRRTFPFHNHNAVDRSLSPGPSRLAPGTRADQAQSNNEKLAMAMEEALRATIGGRTKPYTRDTSWLTALKQQKEKVKSKAKAKGNRRGPAKHQSVKLIIKRSAPPARKGPTRQVKGRKSWVDVDATDDDDEDGDVEVIEEVDELDESEPEVIETKDKGKGKGKARAVDVPDANAKVEKPVGPAKRKDYMSAGFYCQDANVKSPFKLVNKVLKRRETEASDNSKYKGKGKARAIADDEAGADDPSLERPKRASARMSTALSELAAVAEQAVFPPLPYDHGYEHFFGSEHEFVLPYNIAWEMENGGLEGKKKPMPYSKLRANVFPERNKLMSDHNAICNCDPESRCGENCINRAMNYLCGKECPCGELCENKSLAKRRTVPTKVVYTGPRGFGLVVQEDVKEGDFVTDYRGEVISLETFIDRIGDEYKGQRNFYALAYDQDEVIDAGMRGNDARFINHSCDPNLEVRKYQQSGDGIEEYEVGMWAVKDIPKGTELSYDYNFDSFAAATETELRTRCHCGAANCVGFLGRKAGEKSAKEIALQLQMEAKSKAASVKTTKRAQKKVGRKTVMMRQKLVKATEAKQALKRAKKIVKKVNKSRVQAVTTGRAKRGRLIAGLATTAKVALPDEVVQEAINSAIGDGQILTNESGDDVIDPELIEALAASTAERTDAPGAEAPAIGTSAISGRFWQNNSTPGASAEPALVVRKSSKKAGAVKSLLPTPTTANTTLQTPPGTVTLIAAPIEAPSRSGPHTPRTPGAYVSDSEEPSRPLTAEEEAEAAALKRKSGWANWLRREAGEKPRTLEQWHELRMKRRRGVGWMNQMIEEFGIADAPVDAPPTPVVPVEEAVPDEIGEREEKPRGPKWLPQSFENTLAALGQGPDAQPKYRLGGPPVPRSPNGSIIKKTPGPSGSSVKRAAHGSSQSRKKSRSSDVSASPAGTMAGPSRLPLELGTHSLHADYGSQQPQPYFHDAPLHLPHEVEYHVEHYAYPTATSARESSYEQQSAYHPEHHTATYSYRYEQPANGAPLASDPQDLASAAVVGSSVDQIDPSLAVAASTHPASQTTKLETMHDDLFTPVTHHYATPTPVTAGTAPSETSSNPTNGTPGSRDTNKQKAIAARNGAPMGWVYTVDTGASPRQAVDVIPQNLDRSTRRARTSLVREAVIAGEKRLP